MRSKGVAQYVAVLLTVAAVSSCGTDAGGTQSDETPTQSETSATEAPATEPPSEAVSVTPEAEPEALAPESSSDLEGENFEDVIAQLQDAGFTNVETEVIPDLIIGFLVKDGEVEEVSIDGETDFDPDTPFAPDAPVIVAYHTFPEEEGEDESTPPIETEAPEEVLTVKNSKELAAVLRTDDYCDSSIGKFAREYRNRKIQFDGSITTVSKHGNSETRFDIGIGAGNDGPNSVNGPFFKFEDINLSYDLKLAGKKRPDYIREGDLFTFLAEVDVFNADQCIFLLDPVETTAR